ncbi:MAG: Fic family protein [Gammaproteobacteria bacterium]|nr:Fic family protein [Gammaproteobacteria bacterium]MBQ0839633.1 Fic family protein [Gammaproteobacteria bacterium]
MKPYIPDDLPLQGLDYQTLFALVGEANAELARYDGLLQGIPNPAVMLSPLTTQEAVLSSKIEGTQATVDEVLAQEAGLIREGEKYKDIQEISNYRQALFYASEHLKAYPVRLGFIRELHKILLDSVRGQDKTPGAFRKDQNWIGSAGCAIEDASFVPPDPLQLEGFLQAWEAYLDIDDSDFLLQVAVVHAQFELLHPFKDGNGRIGRILIPLFLYQKKALSEPMFYLSEYLEANREEYYQRLKAISEQGDWNGWIAFFLTAIRVQAKQNSARVRAIMALYEAMKVRVHALTHSQYSLHTIDWLFSTPVFRSVDFVNHTEIPRPTAQRIIKLLKDNEILQVVRPARGQQSAILAFPELISIAEGRFEV